MGLFNGLPAKFLQSTISDRFSHFALECSNTTRQTNFLDSCLDKAAESGQFNHTSSLTFVCVLYSIVSLAAVAISCMQIVLSGPRAPSYEIMHFEELGSTLRIMGEMCMSQLRRM